MGVPRPGGGSRLGATTANFTDGGVQAVPVTRTARWMGVAASDGPDPLSTHSQELRMLRVAQCGCFQRCVFGNTSSLAGQRLDRRQMRPDRRWFVWPTPAIWQSCMRYSRLARHERPSTTPAPPI
jgi:hypothetical protein